MNARMSRQTAHPSWRASQRECVVWQQTHELVSLRPDVCWDSRVSLLGALPPPLSQLLSDGWLAAAQQKLTFAVKSSAIFWLSSKLPGRAQRSNSDKICMH